MKVETRTLSLIPKLSKMRPSTNIFESVNHRIKSKHENRISFPEIYAQIDLMHILLTNEIRNHNIESYFSIV
eukprot:UN12621